MAAKERKYASPQKPIALAEMIVTVQLAALPYSDLVKISTPGDMSCFFHSVLRGFNKSYIEAKTWGERKALVRVVRNAAANMLEEKQSNGKLYYDTLSRGALREFGKVYPNVTLSAMQKELRADAAVDNIYHELISNALELDIYLIDMNTGDVYLTTSDLDLFYKGRRSIFIAILHGKKGKDLIRHPDRIGHFDTLGIRDHNGIIHTLLLPTDPFVTLVRNRLYAVAKVPQICVREYLNPL